MTALPLRGIASLASMPIAVAGRIPAAVRRHTRAVAGLHARAELAGRLAFYEDRDGIEIQTEVSPRS